MKRITVVCDDRDAVGVRALIERHVQTEAMIPCRIIDGADLAEFTDDEIARAAADRNLHAIPEPYPGDGRFSA